MKETKYNGENCLDLCDEGDIRFVFPVWDSIPVGTFDYNGVIDTKRMGSKR